MTGTRSIGLMACALAAALALGGCRDNEQDRVLLFHKGHYAGAPDAKLGEATREELRERIRYQSALGGVDHGPAGRAAVPPAGEDVRPPSGSGAPGALRERGAGQSFK